MTGLNKIIDEKVISLLKSAKTKQVDFVANASFIIDCNTRHSTDNQIGFS